MERRGHGTVRKKTKAVDIVANSTTLCGLVCEREWRRKEGGRETARFDTQQSQRKMVSSCARPLPPTADPGARSWHTLTSRSTYCYLFLFFMGRNCWYREGHHNQKHSEAFDCHGNSQKQQASNAQLLRVNTSQSQSKRDEKRETRTRRRKHSLQGTISPQAAP